ncbi:hypothetical protein KUH32_16155 [Thalassococcus sp. CAU 1522]|uniref:Uncharacterized protein n=1 Tax=Thalassococcus arenae TaxID=2851652 RepID=A0ABS6NCK7_9RHOB|nr:hypothetical protein [Thalassococcus arenae]MBV2361299.1 hypothetical protein [Thalassococcus arenae]
MFTPFDTAHMTHRAARHVPASDDLRQANHQRRSARRAAFRAFVAAVFSRAPRHGAPVKPVSSRA